jgi:FtsH-binding integral membrane protein
LLSASRKSLIRASGGGGQSQPTAYSYPPEQRQQPSGSTADSMTPQVRSHLMRVYNLLAIGCGTAACGSAAMILTPLGKIVPYYVPMVGGLGALLWLNFRPPASVTARVGLFLTFTTLEGMSIAPLVKMGAMKGILGSALVMTGAVFIGFSAAALLAPRASLLSLQGPLFGCLLGLMAVSVLNIFWPTAFAHSLILYGGLALFSIFIATDTQSMIERARCGDTDHVQDATSMFMNVLNVFIRLLQIMRSD